MTTSFDDLLATMRRLRDPDGGCPWDLEQTHASLRAALLEESYEVLDALIAEDPARLVEELGDLLLQVVFHAQIGADEGTFAIEDVIAHLNAKLLRRHPHVFGGGAARTSSEGVGQWEQVKAAERAARGGEPPSMLAGVPASMPALAYAEAVLGRVRRAGFDWDDPERSFGKLSEEIAELRTADSPERREEEFGDVLFALVGVAHRMGIDAEQALRGANGRFSRRFAAVEDAARADGATLAEMPESRKLALWERAKRSDGGIRREG